MQEISHYSASTAARNGRGARRGRDRVQDHFPPVPYYLAIDYRARERPPFARRRQDRGRAQRARVVELRAGDDLPRHFHCCRAGDAVPSRPGAGTRAAWLRTTTMMMTTERQADGGR